MLPLTRTAASKKNPRLELLGAFVGTWRTVGTHPMVPGKTFNGRTTFDWIEGGAFFVMRSQIDEPEIPSGIGVFGTDDGTGGCRMLYFDERDVSRHYEVTLQDGVLSWSRDDADLSQRVTMTLSPDRRTITGVGQMSQKGGPWKGDLSLTYTRVE
jgi:hypothetical protein